MRRDAWAFDYLPNGGGEVCENLAAKIMQLGGEIRLAVPCDSSRKRKRVDCVYSTRWTSRIRDASFIILASNSPAAESIIKQSFPSESASLFFPHGLAHAVIRLWFDKRPRKNPEAGIFSGDFIMHNFFWLDKIYDGYRKWHEETGGSCIEVHVYGPQNVLAQPDAILLTNVLRDVYRVYPELKGHLIKPHIQRNAATHTLPALGARGTHLGIETTWENFFCAGDWVRHETPAFFLERACVTGTRSRELYIACPQNQ